MGVALGAVIGLVVGGLIGWSVAGVRHRALRTELAEARVRVEAAAETERRLREDRERDRETLRAEMKVISNDAIRTAMEDVTRSRDEALARSQAELDRSLTPLAEQLTTYRDALQKFEVTHARSVGDLHHGNERVLEELARQRDATARLNQILGRGDQRGRWGEIQLANVLRASGLQEGRDYVMQVTTVSADGAGQRPDCVINLPHGVRIAVDAKFPFDRFEESVGATSDEERRRSEAEHARALRAHVKTLADKRYWKGVEPSPEMVVCFVPSDQAIVAALAADPDLLADAAAQNVLITGPTGLNALLLSVALVVREYTFARNADEILQLATELSDRVSVFAGHLEKIRVFLTRQVETYNLAVGSFERNIGTTIRRIRELGGVRSAKELPELSTVDVLARQLGTTTLPADHVSEDVEDSPSLLDGVVVEDEGGDEGPE